MKDVTKVKIQILGQEFVVHVGKTDKMEPKPHWVGACHGTQKNICVRTDTEDDQLHTMLHELVHAHLTVSGAEVFYTEKEAESVCNLFAAIMTQYIRQNPLIWHSLLGDLGDVAG